MYVYKAKISLRCKKGNTLDNSLSSESPSNSDKKMALSEWYLTTLGSFSMIITLDKSLFKYLKSLIYYPPSYTIDSLPNLPDKIL